MPEFKTPLHKRLAASERWRRRYANDPEFRLAHQNRCRRSLGLPLLKSVDDLRTRAEFIAQRPRGERGKFL